MRKQSSVEAVYWFKKREKEPFFLSAVTIAELCDGIERLPASTKKQELEAWLYGEVSERFKQQILSIDEKVAREWGCLHASMRRKGICIGIQELYIAATAKVHQLIVVTCNVRDFSSIEGLPLANPWA